jgi:hypothetical protein
MTTVQVTLNLPDSLAKAAAGAGLLKPDALEKLLSEAVRRKGIDEFFAAADSLAGANYPPLSLEAIQEEVKAVRSARRQSADK